MRERPVDLNPKLEALILQKSYENLDASELNFVQTQISAADYTAFRVVLLNAKEVFKDAQTTPDATINKNLSAAMLQRHRSKQPVAHSINRVASYRIPVWQALAGAAAMLLCFLYFGKHNQIMLEPEKVIVYKTDTLYKKTPAVLVRDTVYEKYKAPKKKSVYRKPSTALNEDTMSIKAINASPKDIFVEEPSVIYRKKDTNTPLQKVDYPVGPQGRSVEKDKALMELLERVY